MKTLETLNMKGQSRAAEQAQVWIDGITEGKPIRPCLLSAPSGTGKTHLLNLMTPHLEAKGFEVVRITAFSSTMRGQKDCLTKIKEPYFDSGKKFALFCDEFHTVKGGGGMSSAVSMAWETALLLMGGTEVPPMTSFPLYIGEESFIDWRNIALIGATNLPGQLESAANRKDGQAPFRRRFYNVELSKYGKEIIGEVIGDFLSAQGLKASECATGVISRFHRGTMEAIDTVITQYKLSFPGVKVITRDKLIQAARLTTWFPRGIMRPEARLLAKLVESGGRLKVDMAAPILDCTSKEVTGAAAHLFDQYAENGEHTPFIEKVGSAVIITAAGRKYTAAVAKEGFTL